MSLENINFFIKILTLNDYSGVQIHNLLENVLGNECVKVRRVQQLMKEYRNGRVSIESGNEMNLGRPRELKTDENVNFVREMIEEDSRVSVRQIAQELGLPKSTVHEMITEDCGFQTVSCKWVPYALNDHHKANRVELCTELSNILQRRGMRQRLFVCDEKWVYFKNFPSGNAAKCWVPSDGAGDKAQLVRKSLCMKKRMIIVACNFLGDSYFEILEDGGSINADRYIEFLRNCFRYLRDNGIPTERILWMHDNARPHRARVTEQFLDDSIVTKVRQPAYSPDLNLMDRYVFRNFENGRLRVDFESVNEIRNYLTQFLASLTEQKLYKEFNVLQTHCTNVIAAHGCYL